MMTGTRSWWKFPWRRCRARIEVWGAAYVGQTTGYSTERGNLSAVIYPPDDVKAQEWRRVDTLRRAIRKTAWSDVPDAAVERIAAILQEVQP